MVANIVCWGEVLWDRFPAGAQLGGAPANVAWHLALLGAPVAMITRVGDDDDGREAARRMAARGIDTSLVQVDAERGTGEVEVAVDPASGEPRYRLVPERAWERIAVTPAARLALARAPALVYGTLAQRAPEGLAAWREALAACGPATLRICDPNLRPGRTAAELVAEALDAADVIKLGEREAEACAQLLGVGTVDGLILWLLGRPAPPDARRARLIALTRGADGSTLITADDAVEIAPVAAAPGGDNVGCGDAYVAVLAHGLVAGWDLPRLGAVASRWAAAVAGVRGATPDLDAATVAALVEAAP
jgi:fructokinase